LASSPTVDDTVGTTAPALVDDDVLVVDDVVLVVDDVVLLVVLLDDVLLLDAVDDEVELEPPPLVIWHFHAGRQLPVPAAADSGVSGRTASATRTSPPRPTMSHCWARLLRGRCMSGVPSTDRLRRRHPRTGKGL
jgi:hypothetical protein